jgi:hypothetical protein
MFDFANLGFARWRISAPGYLFTKSASREAPQPINRIFSAFFRSGTAWVGRGIMKTPAGK